MQYVKSAKYDTPALQAKIMGPNPIKLEEELLTGHKIPKGSAVCQERGYLYIAIPGMKQDCHDDLPAAENT